MCSAQVLEQSELVEKLFLSLGEALEGQLRSTGALLCPSSFLGIMRDYSHYKLLFSPPLPERGFGSLQSIMWLSAAEPGFCISILCDVWGGEDHCH